MTLAFMLATPTTHAEEDEDYSDEWIDIAEIPPDPSESDESESNLNVDNNPVSIQEWRREQFGDDKAHAQRAENSPPEVENPPDENPQPFENPC